MDMQDFHSLLNVQHKKRPTMLIYFIPQDDQPHTPEFLMAQAKTDSLIRTWEVAGLPLAFIGGGWTWNRTSRRPRPGDLFFATNAPSLLRDRNFQSLDEDLGVPELLLAGGTFEEKIIPTAVDAYLSGRPISVASETLFFKSSGRRTECERANFRALLSSYARVFDAGEISGGRLRA